MSDAVKCLCKDFNIFIPANNSTTFVTATTNIVRYVSLTTREKITGIRKDSPITRDLTFLTNHAPCSRNSFSTHDNLHDLQEKVTKSFVDSTERLPDPSGSSR